jgi:NitT/TauT family transport system permease protein
VRRALHGVAFLAALVLLWHGAVAAGLWPRVLLPPPLEVAQYLVRALGDASLVEASWVTGRRLFVGYLLGLAVGLPVGFLTARVRLAADTVGQLALGLQTLPSVCWVPLALLWFGQTEGAMLFVVVMGTVWSVALATETGIRSIPPIYVRAARTMGSRGVHTLVRVVLPASLPTVVAGMKQGWAFAWRSLMAAEIYVTIITGFGLGHLLHYGRELHAMDQVLAVMLVIVLVGLVADKALFSPLERFLRRRWGLEVGP